MRAGELCLVALALLLAGHVQLASALYSKGGAVLTLDAKNFDDLISKPEGAAIVEFYAPWCGHCKNLVPHFKATAEKLKVQS
jgi:protein disulfide-isomerase A6